MHPFLISRPEGEEEFPDRNAEPPTERTGNELRLIVSPLTPAFFRDRNEGDDIGKSAGSEAISLSFTEKSPQLWTVSAFECGNHSPRSRFIAIERKASVVIDFPVSAVGTDAVRHAAADRAVPRVFGKVGFTPRAGAAE